MVKTTICPEDLRTIDGKQTQAVWQILSQGKVGKLVQHTKGTKAHFKKPTCVVGSPYKSRKQETCKVHFQKPTCVAGSPYQKDDSLYDDYDGDNAAGQ